jgi:hypothetical protein
MDVPTRRGVFVIGEWEAMKRYIVERAREDATTGPNPTLRTLAQHVLRAVDESGDGIAAFSYAAREAIETADRIKGK